MLDVTFGEDRARASREDGAETLALVRKLVINLLKNAPTSMQGESLATKRRRASRRIHYLTDVLRAGVLIEPGISQG